MRYVPMFGSMTELRGSLERSLLLDCWVRNEGPSRGPHPYLIKSLVLASADSFVESFDPGFLFFPTGGLEFDVTDL